MNAQPQSKMTYREAILHVLTHHTLLTATEIWEKAQSLGVFSPDRQSGLKQVQPKLSELKKEGLIESEDTGGNVLQWYIPAQAPVAEDKAPEPAAPSVANKPVLIGVDLGQGNDQTAILDFGKDSDFRPELKKPAAIDPALPEPLPIRPLPQREWLKLRADHLLDCARTHIRADLIDGEHFDLLQDWLAEASEILDLAARKFGPEPTAGAG
jgi:hypothetical protein